LGHRAVDYFLASSWDDSSSKYVNCKFDDLRSQKRLTRILLEEQHYHCCYCMRDIDLGDSVDHPHAKVTLEHIVPFKTKKEDFPRNLDRMPKRFKKTVVWGCEEDFKQYTHKYTVPPYPHIFAYENLSASCDGSIGDIKNNASFFHLHNTCNNCRGEKEIIPLFLKKNAIRNINYASDGTLLFDDDKYEATINALNLEFDTLTLIRKAWFEITQYHDSSEVLKARNDKGLRENILEDTALTEDERSTFRNETMWELLSQYEWFYHYYKYKYPAFMKKTESKN